MAKPELDEDEKHKDPDYSDSEPIEVSIASTSSSKRPERNAEWKEARRRKDASGVGLIDACPKCKTNRYEYKRLYDAHWRTGSAHSSFNAHVRKAMKSPELPCEPIFGQPKEYSPPQKQQQQQQQQQQQPQEQPKEAKEEAEKKPEEQPNQKELPADLPALTKLFYDGSVKACEELTKEIAVAARSEAKMEAEIASYKRKAEELEDDLKQLREKRMKADVTVKGLLTALNDVKQKIDTLHEIAKP